MRLILLLNMGGPNDLSEVGVFLKNMFNDPYILGIKSPILRKFVAFMITSSRLKTAQNNYRQIGGKSPICELTARLCGTNQLRLVKPYWLKSMRFTASIRNMTTES